MSDCTVDGAACGHVGSDTDQRCRGLLKLSLRKRLPAVLECGFAEIFHMSPYRSQSYPTSLAFLTRHNLKSGPFNVELIIGVSRASTVVRNIRILSRTISSAIFEMQIWICVTTLSHRSELNIWYQR